MKEIVHKILGSIRNILASLILKNLKSGVYWVSYPVYHTSLQPACSSTYIDDVKLYGSSIADRWARDACGIASLKIAIESIKRVDNHSFSLSSISTLSEMAKKDGAYIDTIGWKHKSLISIAKKYGLSGSNFVEEGHLSICANILKNRIVIASVTLYFRGGKTIVNNGIAKKLPKGGHLIVLKAFKWENGKCAGFIYDDCQDEILRDNAVSESFVSISDFSNSYSGKVIYIWN